MKAKHKKLCFCLAALGLFLSSLSCNEARAEYVEPTGKFTVIDGNNGGSRLFTSSTNFDYYKFLNINSPGQNGGALVATGNIGHSLFENNYANRGGAYYTPQTSGLGTIIMETVKFVSNRAENMGGAISSDAVMLQVNNSVFEKNYAGTRGGAIHYLSNPSFGMNVIQNCEFIDNKSGQTGGAIYVSLGTGTELTITANDNKTHYMTGNMQNVASDTASPSSNAIYIEKGKVTIATRGGSGSKYIINDGIQGDNAYSMDNAKLNIRGLDGGTVELNNKIKNLILTHEAGTLSLNKANKIENGGSILDNVDLSLKPSSGNDIRFDMQNGKIDNLKIRNFSVSTPTDGNKIVIAMDVDLKNGVADNFEVSQGMNGKLQFDSDHFELNLINDGDADKFQLFNKTFDIEGELVQYLGSAKYVYSIGENGFINVVKDATGGLYEAVSTSTPIREFRPEPSMDIALNKDLGDLGGESLKMNLSGSDFDGAGFSGINVSDGQKLELKNIGSIDNDKSMHDFSGENGSIVKNEGGTVTVTDSCLKNNTASVNGGAIYNLDGEVILNAEQKGVILSNNSANGILNDIYMEQSAPDKVAALTVKGDKNTLIGSGIKGSGQIKKQGLGALILGGDNSEFTGDLYLESGEIRINDGATFFNVVNSHLSDNTTLNLINNNTNDNINLGDLNLEGNVSLNLDANGSTGDSDKIGAASVKGDGKILINNVNLTAMGDPSANNMDFSVISLDANGESPLLGNVEMSPSASEILAPIFKYKTTYNPETGILSLTGGGKRSDGYNPAVLTGSVATLVGGYLTQLNSYDMAFNNSDTYMLMNEEQRRAIKHMNKYASLGGGLYSNSGLYEDRNAWFKPYTTFESVRLQRGPRVSNVAYGSFFGYDSEIKEMGKGFDGMWSLYAGYNGSHQAYQGNGIWQNGGTLGATGVLYKGNFFTALTANVGANAGQADTMYGDENFTMITSGIASKTGYNIETFGGKFIIQPSYLMSYSFIKTLDYTSAYGLDINSKPLNAIQITPGIRMIGNLPKGFQPYIGCSMVFNIVDDTRFKANDVALPELSVRPYFNYGVGIQKKGERFSGYFQTMLRAGGRNGVGLQGGIQISI